MYVCVYVCMTFRTLPYHIIAQKKVIYVSDLIPQHQSQYICEIHALSLQKMSTVRRGSQDVKQETHEKQVGLHVFLFNQ